MLRLLIRGLKQIYTFMASLNKSQIGATSKLDEAALASYEHQPEWWTPLVLFLALPLTTGFFALCLLYLRVLAIYIYITRPFQPAEPGG